MIKILFICHGNICRSPMAEFIMKDLLIKHKIDHQIIIASCATSTEEIWNGIGNPIYPPAKKELMRRGISVDNKRAIQLQTKDYTHYDLLVCMDQTNIKNALRILGDDSNHKLCRLLDYTNNPRDVADPWYSNRFDIAYADIYEGCLALIESLEKNLL